MQCLKQFAKITFTAPERCLLGVRTPIVNQVATVMKLDKPPSYDDVEFPLDNRRRLKMFDKVPQPLHPGAVIQTMRKSLYLMRGPEEVHNKILYGEFAIQATSGGRLHFGHLEAIRFVIARKMDESKTFAVWRVDAPWMPVSNQGSNRKMGGGKGPIDRFMVPVKADRMIIEIGGKVEFIEVKALFEQIINQLPIKARIVTRKSMEEAVEKEKELERLNQNPFTFKYCAKKNMLGIDIYLSPYDYKWSGKYR